MLQIVPQLISLLFQEEKFKWTNKSTVTMENELKVNILEIENQISIFRPPIVIITISSHKIVSNQITLFFVFNNFCTLFLFTFFLFSTLLKLIEYKIKTLFKSKLKKKKTFPFTTDNYFKIFQKTSSNILLIV